MDSIVTKLSSVFHLSEVNLSEAIIVICLSFVLGIVIGCVYKASHTSFGYSQSFVVTLVMMCTVISLVILIVGSNVARAFSLGGALSIIRFRMALHEPKDVAYIFFATAAGLAVGAGAYVYAVVGVILLSIFIIVITKINAFSPIATAKTLKIVIPEDLNYEGRFEPVLSKYCTLVRLRKVMNIDLGTLFELVFDVNVKKDISEKEMLDEIRAMNGNLKISLVLQGEIAD